MKAAAAEQRGTRQSSCSCPSTLAGTWPVTNAKPSLPSPPLIHANSAPHMKALLYSPCLSSCHVAFLLAVNRFFLSQVRVPEMLLEEWSRRESKTGVLHFCLLKIQNFGIFFSFLIFFLPALEQQGHIFIEQAVPVLRCIS